MKLLTSKKFNLPKIFFVSEKEKLKELPIGIPFFFASPGMEDYIVRILEYEILYQEAIKTGYPFDWRQILLDAGYEDVENFCYGDSVYMEFKSSDYSEISDKELPKFETLANSVDEFKRFVRDSSCYVNIEVLKNLKVFPTWLQKIEDAISTNIHSFATFNPNLYNKKLEGMYGGLELSSPNRNLIIIDISGSIPRAVSSTCLTLAKNLTESFYADLIITGSISTFYPYEEIYKLDVTKAYENGTNNDQAYFKKIVSEVRKYKTAVVFGDNDSPCNFWAKGDQYMSIEDGKKLCKFEVEHLISLHTKGTEHLAAYSSWFSPTTEERVADWVKYLNK